LLSRNRLSVAASAGTTARYYPSLTDDVLRRDSASLSAVVRIAEGLSANASAAYLPYSLSSLLASSLDPVASSLDPDVDDLAVPDADFVSSGEYLVAYGAGLSYQRQVSRRTTFSSNYQYRARQSSRQSRQFERHGVGGRLSYAAARGLNLRAGYGYSEARYVTSGVTRRRHLIDAGADYNRALSISRRTTLSFGTGTTATTRPESDIDRTRFRLTGNVGLNHEIGRTWNAAIAYSRAVRLDENWPEPVFSDGVTARLGGLISRRVSFQSSARASTGRVGFGERSGFNSYRGAASLNFALSRYAGLGVAYSYYYHRFQEAVTLLPGLPAGIDRHSVRAYVNVWAPLFHRSRRSDATR
jgi:hypothetical protein